MNNESIDLLREINNSIKNIEEDVDNIEMSTGMSLSSEYLNKNDISDNSISNSDFNVHILSLIFGFIVGYCLIKSFFDGLKI